MYIASLLRRGMRGNPSRRADLTRYPDAFRSTMYSTIIFLSKNRLSRGVYREAGTTVNGYSENPFGKRKLTPIFDK